MANKSTRIRKYNLITLFVVALFAAFYELQIPRSSHLITDNIYSFIIIGIAFGLIVNFSLPLLIARLINFIANLFRKSKRPFSYIVVWVFFLIITSATVFYFLSLLCC